MKVMRKGVLAVLLLATVLAPRTGWAIEKLHNGRSTYAAMWWSILHPGLGEWYLNGWGPFEDCPQKKFWIGFIPIYGWPGYLQVKSAIDARHGRTNDKLTF
jgi:hypothetical protein